MNFVTGNYLWVRIPEKRVLFSLILVALLSACLAGCGDEVRPSSAAELADFQKVGILHPTEDLDPLGSARTGAKAYRSRPGEVLELTMPAVLQIATAEESGGTDAAAPYVCRISEAGTISLPVVGEIQVAGKTLGQIESAVIDAYYPKYAVARPAVFARWGERLEQPPVTVIGLVNKPGSYPYPPDIQYNLMQAVGLAGGLNIDLDPRYAMVYRLKPDGEIARAIFQIQKGEELEDALAARIRPGDIVAVEHTPRTRTNAFLARIFSVHVGAYVPVWK